MGPGLGGMLGSSPRSGIVGDFPPTIEKRCHHDETFAPGVLDRRGKWCWLACRPSMLDLPRGRTWAWCRSTPRGVPLNLGFEAGSLKDWRAEGDAFAGGPVEGDAVSKRRGDMKSRLTRGGSGSAPTSGRATRLGGLLTSVPFPLTKPYVSFLIGAGSFATTRAEVVRADNGAVHRQGVGRRRRGHEPGRLRPDPAPRPGDLHPPGRRRHPRLGPRQLRRLPGPRHQMPEVVRQASPTRPTPSFTRGSRPRPPPRR